MNEELQKALVELLSKANNGIDEAGGFLAAELPEVIKQLLIWNGIYNFILFIIAVAIVALIKPVISECILKNNKAKEDYKNEVPWTRYNGCDSTTSHAYDLIKFIYIIPFVQFTIGISIINMKWLQIWIAPKVWLLEYAAKLAN